MINQNNFDTHAFVKSYVAAKTDEAKAEMLANTIVSIKQDNNEKIEYKFDDKKNEFVNQKEFESKFDLLLKEIKSLRNEMYGKFDTFENIMNSRFDISENAMNHKIELSKKDTQLKMYIAIGGLGVFLTTIILGVLPFVLRGW